MGDNIETSEGNKEGPLVICNIGGISCENVGLGPVSFLSREGGGDNIESGEPCKDPVRSKCLLSCHKAQSKH